eukprot:TRINITY_DN18408_c0_g1_i4.p1 TRINITY_DN18408_c0_g1~~TRINITY_DN18408_c0_g1_i4.p1  ORF type:complete len:201 (+),score=-15.25 TRINITY_DN18408_c0_g1_i4:528-1130(+)
MLQQRSQKFKFFFTFYYHFIFFFYFLDVNFQYVDKSNPLKIFEILAFFGKFSRRYKNLSCQRVQHIQHQNNQIQYILHLYFKNLTKIKRYIIRILTYHFNLPQSITTSIMHVCNVLFLHIMHAYNMYYLYIQYDNKYTYSIRLFDYYYYKKQNYQSKHKIQNFIHKCTSQMRKKIKRKIKPKTQRLLFSFFFHKKLKSYS